ncbi:MAG: hypothetical protein JST00_23610 [Deltaproteobacteria bacterium]|nr:hypothetical protein [Deltaproteobacteria bacterium]
MRIFPLLGFLVFSSLATAATGCDEVAKAIDANNNQPGEADGRAVELSAVPQRLANLAVDANEMWIVAENGDVLERPRSDAKVAPVKVGGYARRYHSDGIRALLDADSLYVVDGDSVSRMPRAGGPFEKLAEIWPAGMAMTADAIFVAKDVKRVVKIDKKTKAVSDLAGGFGFLVDMVLDGNRLIVVDRDLETITAIALDTGAKTDLAKNQSRPYAVGLGPDHVYWGNGSLSDTNKAVEDRIFRIKKDGSGQPEPVMSTTGGSANKLAADGQFLYVGRYCGGLERVPVTGGEPKKFLNAAVQDLELSGSSVLVLEDNGCRFDEAAKNQPNRLLTVTK